MNIIVKKDVSNSFKNIGGGIVEKKSNHDPETAASDDDRFTCGINRINIGAAKNESDSEYNEFLAQCMKI